MACAIAFSLTLPIGIIEATNKAGTFVQPCSHYCDFPPIELYLIVQILQEPGLNFIRYIYPDKPLANVAFKTYGTCHKHSVFLVFQIGPLYEDPSKVQVYYPG